VIKSENRGIINAGVASEITGIPPNERLYRSDRKMDPEIETVALIRSLL
jgi:hypothetical protein